MHLTADELGAAFLCADLRITNSPREDHAAYIAGWLKALKNDKKAIFTAAHAASNAAAYLAKLQPPNEPGESKTSSVGVPTERAEAGQ